MSAPTPQSPVPGLNLLLMGETGTGKTYSIRSWIDAGIEVRALFTDPGMESCTEIPCPKLHFAYVPQLSPSWESLKSTANYVNMFENEALQKMNKTQAGSGQYRGWIDMLELCSNFRCQRCGVALGDMSQWGTGVVFVIDGLGGLGELASSLHTGAKPLLTMPDYGVIMKMIEQQVVKLTGDKRCHFMLISHVEKEFDEVTNSMRMMAGTVGKKLAPKLPKHFSDVILARRVGDQFYWDTKDSNTALKTRNFPISNQLAPSIRLAVENWKKRGGIVEPVEPPAAPVAPPVTPAPAVTPKPTGAVHPIFTPVLDAVKGAKP